MPSPTRNMSRDLRGTAVWERSNYPRKKAYVRLSYPLTQTPHTLSPHLIVLIRVSDHPTATPAPFR